MAIFQIVPAIVKIVVEVPALDRLVTFLQQDAQAQIDAAVQQLKQSNSALQGAIEKES